MKEEIYKIDMLCKHFKGKTLLEKNIYKIIALHVNGKDVDQSKITYSGDRDLQSATNLVIYANIFQDNRLFAREYEDISSELSIEKKNEFNQDIRVQPLNFEEIKLVSTHEFREEKIKYTQDKFKKDIQKER